MAVEEIVYSTSVIAGSDLSAKQFYCVKLNASGQIVLSGAGENALGILQDKPASGQVGAVCCLGKSMAMLGSEAVAGQNLTPDSVGRLVPATGSDAVVAVAAESGSVGEVRSVYVVSRATSGAIQKSILSIPVKLSKIANGDLLTEFTPGFPGRIVKVSFVIVDPVTTSDKVATLNLEIGSTNVSGGVLSLTSANCGTLGAVVNATTITENNVFDADDTISIEASGVTAFAEGEGVLLIVIG
jgi:Ca2+-binding RTX toxin-like protein